MENLDMSIINLIRQNKNNINKPLGKDSNGIKIPLIKSNVNFIKLMTTITSEDFSVGFAGCQ